MHFREPGNEHKENLYHGTAGAIMGGITGVFEMPNTNPSTTSVESMADKVSRAEKSAWSNYSFYMGACPENVDELTKLENVPGCCGVKIFMGSSTGSLLVDEEALLNLALKNGKRRVAVHCELESRLIERKDLALKGKPETHPVWRDELTGLLATQLLVKLARENNRPIHTLHITTAEEMEFLKDQKDIATVEVLPQHLTLSAPECYERLGTLAQMNPPIRDKRHQDALWKAVTSGIVDVMASDHAPHTLEEKNNNYTNAPSGGPLVQHALVALMEAHHKGKISVESKLDVGTTFFVEIRLKKELEIKEDVLNIQPKKSIINLKGKKVLVADDDILNQTIVCHFLDKENAGITIVKDGLEALTMVIPAFSLSKKCRNYHC